MRRLIACIAVAIVLAPDRAVAQAAARPYTLGGGVPIGSTGIRLGGYLAIDLEKPAAEDPSLTFDDLSLFVFGDVRRHGRFFIEIEDTKFWQVQNGHSVVQHHIDLERLYFDYLHSDALKVRVGKFLTPVGTWNEIHPDPLTWTVSRPLASYATFPTFVTGVAVSGVIARETHDVEYDVFAQANECIDCTTGERHTERLLGGRIRWKWNTFQVGLPVVHFVDRDTAAVTTFTGADMLSQAGPVELRGEATIGGVRIPSDAGTRLEYAWYLQASYAVTDRHAVVVRGERARSPYQDPWSAWSAAGVYRPKSAMSFKLEFQQRAGHFPVEEGGRGRRVLASFGVLF